MQKNNELISVVVPIYNIDQYVGHCIESIIKQTYDKLEIILVNDGSTDRCSAICDLYARKDSRIKVIHKPNGGLVRARKAGVAVASGNFIGYVDGDDWIEPDYYATLHKAAMKSKADIICAGYSRDLFTQSVRCADSILDGIYTGASLEGVYREMLSCGESFNVGITTYVWNKLIRSDIAKVAQRDVDEGISIGEDAAVTYPALLMAERIYVCDNTSYHYRQHEGSMLKLHASFEEERKKLIRLYTYLESIFLQDERRNVLISQLSDFILGNCIIRSGGAIEGFNPFGVDIRDKRVVIIEAGTIGQLMYERLNGYCVVTGWYDTDYWEYRRCCMNVDPLDAITDDFDYALIAKIDREEIESIANALADAGIPQEKILGIEYGNLDREAMLAKYMNFAH